MTKKGKYNSPWQATLQGIRDRNKKEGKEVHLPERIDLKNKTVMITGASSGLGWATALRCARAGAKVIMVIRSGFPGKIEELRSITGNPNVEGYQVDLSDFNSIKAMLDRVVSDGIQVDILISNAAMVALKSRHTAQGLEEMFMVNYLAPFYLINQLISLGVVAVSNDSPARIIIVSSESHRNSEAIDWDSFGTFSEYAMNKTVNKYGYYKLMLTTFAVELSRRFQENNITVKALCPGPVNSNIAREAPKWMQPLLGVVFSIFFKSPAKACDPVIYFASEPGITEKFNYLFLMSEKEVDPLASDPVNRQLLWEKSVELCREHAFPLTAV